MGKYQTINGTPWHVETLHKDEDDDRRHRSRCAYYNKDHMCTYYATKCIGSNKCDAYKEKTNFTTLDNQFKRERHPDRKENLCIYLKENKCTYSHPSECYDYKNCSYYKRDNMVPDKNEPCIYYAKSHSSCIIKGRKCIGNYKCSFYKNK